MPIPTPMCVSHPQVNWQELVDRDFLKLSDLFRRGIYNRATGSHDLPVWEVVRELGSVRYPDEPELIRVRLEVSTRYGITAYRWNESTDGNTSEVYLDPADAERDAAEHIRYVKQLSV